MERRSLIIFGLLALGTVSVSLAVLLPQSEEEQVASQLHGLAGAVGFSEPIESPLFFGSVLADRLEPYVADHVDVQVDEVDLNPPQERGRLAVAAAMALARYAAFEVRLSGLEIALTNGGAEVAAVARVSATSAGTLRSDQRRVHFSLDKSSGTFLVTAVRAERPTEPSEP